jgi:dTDP-4-dehydrorhamnose reductase
LFGAPGSDFPDKILAAAETAADEGRPLRVVGDEFGSPTFSHDVAEAIVELLGSEDWRGVHHVVNGGVASRADWARELVRQVRLDVSIEEVPSSSWERPSRPPEWGVLEPTPLPSGEPLRAWQAALADYLPTLLRRRAGSVP